MSERTFFSLRYALPGYTLVLMIVLVAYPKLYTIFSQIEDVALVGAFLAFLTILGGSALGFLVSQVWYVLYHRFRRGKYGRVPKTLEFLRKEYGITKDMQHQIVFLDYVNNYLSEGKRRAYTQRRFDLMHLFGSTLFSTLIGSLLGILIRIGAFRSKAPLELSFEPLKKAAEIIKTGIENATTYDFGVVVLVLILCCLLALVWLHVGNEQSMMLDILVRNMVNSGDFSYWEARRIFTDDYFSARNFFLDTGALIALSGLKDPDAQFLKRRLQESDSQLSVTHIQVDEKQTKELQNYQRKIQKALESLKNKGISIRIEETKIVVAGVSRVDFARLGDEEIGRLYDELRREIHDCEKAKGKPKPLLNIACDAAIAVSSLNHDFFVTTDKCLVDSWHKTIRKNRTLRQQSKVPKIIYSHPNSNEVAKNISELLS